MMRVPQSLRNQFCEWQHCAQCLLQTENRWAERSQKTARAGGGSLMENFIGWHLTGHLASILTMAAYLLKEQVSGSRLIEVLKAALHASKQRRRDR